ncbi:MAG: hypothetical protein ACKVZH_22025, partial [Blastocatellia bacterium]
MRLAGAAKLFASFALWRGLHFKSAGRALVKALGENDEDLRVIAGMFLTRSGTRSAPLLGEALSERRGLPIVLQIIADIQAKEFEPQLRQFAGDSDPQVSQAARCALKQLFGD